MSSSTKNATTKKSNKRVRKVANHRSFKLTKTKIKPAKPLPKIWQLYKQPWQTIMANKKLYFGLTLVNILLILVFTKGFGTAFNFLDARQEVFDIIGEEDRSLETSYFLFSYLVGTGSSATSSTGSIFQLLILLVTVLATIWITRQVFAGEKPRFKQAFYEGMYPIIPFILLVLIISIQLIPVVIGNFIFSTVVTGGIAVTPIEQFLWFLLMLLTLVLSLYWVVTSIFALNIVTLKNTGPIEAYKTARDLVLHRRLGIIARLLLLLVVLIILVVGLFVPLISITPLIVEPLFLAFSSFLVVYVTVYMYNFYRGLL